jgi:hypothetical protein
MSAGDLADLDDGHCSLEPGYVHHVEQSRNGAGYAGGEMATRCAWRMYVKRVIAGEQP